MKSKKIMSAALAGAMALSMSVTAFAAGETSQANTMSVPGDVAAPTIKVVIPDANTVGKLILNPYGLRVDIGAGKLAAGAEAANEESTDQVTAKVAYLKNLSDADMKVTVAAAGTASTGVTLAAAPIVESAAKPVATKSVYLYYEVQVSDDDEGTGTSWLPDVFVPTNKDTAGKATVIGKMPGAAATLPSVVLAKSEDGTDPADAKGYAAIHIGGNASSSPTTAWAAGDKVDVAFTFTFTPTVMETSSGN